MRAGTDAVYTARYLARVQSDTAALTADPDQPESHENAGPAYLRDRARHYRELAAQQSDPKRATLFRELAASFEQYARTKERRAAHT